VVSRIDFIFESKLDLYQTEPVYFIQSHLWDPLTDLRIAFIHGIENHKEIEVFTEHGKPLLFTFKDEIRIYKVHKNCKLIVKVSKAMEEKLQQSWVPHREMKAVINKNEIRAISKGFYESVFDLYKGHPFRKFFFTPEEAQISVIRKAKRQSNFFEIYFGFRTTNDVKQKQLEELVLNLSIVPTHPLEIMTFPNAMYWCSLFIRSANILQISPSAHIGVRRFLLYFMSWFKFSSEELLKLRNFLSTPKSQL